VIRRLVRWLLWAAIGLLAGATLLVAAFSTEELGTVAIVTLPAAALLYGLIRLLSIRLVARPEQLYLADTPGTSGSSPAPSLPGASGGLWRSAARGLVWALIAFLVLAVLLVGIANPADALKTALPALIGIGALSSLLRVLAPRPAGRIVLQEQPGAAAGGPTVALHLGPAERLAIYTGIAQAVRLFTGWAIGPAVVLFLLGLLLGSTFGAPLELAAALALPGIVVGLAVGLGGWWTIRRLKRDLAEGLFYRTTGPIQLVGSRNPWVLELADQAFIVGWPVARPLAALGWGTVDHTPRGHLILEVRDADGQVVYRARGYEGGDGSTRPGLPERV
jgi:hypothetical protein